MNRQTIALIVTLLAFGYLGYQIMFPERAAFVERIAEPELLKPVYYVNPSGNDGNDGLTTATALRSIQKAVDLAQPGDVVLLEKGTYFESFVSRRNGLLDKPIVIEGTREAIVKGGDEGDRIIEINHDYITLLGFTVDGLRGTNSQEKNYKDKLVYALGIENKNGVEGLKIIGMELKNAGGECVRLRYFTRKAEIAKNVIKNCGAYDFKFNAGGKNGEGIYIGTAPEQTKDGKNETKDRDESNDNWVHNNVIDTQGNECVDIKESSSGNLVENNKCTGQKDPQSAGMDARGSNNTIRKNEIYDNVGAGVRLGGDKEEDGINNVVVENIIRNNQGGGIKLEQFPQGELCRNTFIDNGGKKDFVGEFTNDEEIQQVLDKCK